MIASAARKVQYIVRKQGIQGMIHFTNPYYNLTATLVHCTEKKCMNESNEYEAARLEGATTGLPSFLVLVHPHPH